MPEAAASVSKAYRPEIDGLRAVAVLSVLLFHLDFEFARGGFIGVDVFFVISGYLITRLISSEVYKTGGFDYTRFYVRRVRRIFPALLASILFTFAFASALLSPSHLARFGEAMAMSVVSLSNFYFWTESGYFDVSSEYKPLLHTWSLSVEEQYYLIWPAILVFYMRRVKKSPLYLLSALFGLSFVGSLLVYNGFGWIGSLEDALPRDERAVFFLTPFRIYEFAIGAIMVWTVGRRPAGSVLAELLFLAGLFAIVFAACVYDEQTVFPVYPMLLPCLGAALIIHSEGSRYAAFLLRNRLMVWIGSISYSLYLVHWPVIVLYGYWRLVETSVAEKIGLAAVCFLLGYALFVAFEQRFRIVGSAPGLVYSKRLLLPFALVVAGLVGLAFGPVLGKGWEWRFPAEITAKIREGRVPDAEVPGPCRYRIGKDRGARHLDENFISLRFEKCLESSGPAVVIVGDSHGIDLFHVVAALGSHDHVVGFTRGGCRPHDERDGCQYEFASDWVAQNRDGIDLLLYTQKGSHFLAGRSDLPVLVDSVKRTAGYLSRLQGLVPTIWIGPRDEPNVDISVYNEAINWRRLEFRNNPYIRDVNDIIAREAESRGIGFVDSLMQVGFDFQEDFEVDGKFTYNDTDHWNAWGERVLGSRLMAHPLLQEYLKDPE